MKELLAFVAIFTFVMLLTIGAAVGVQNPTVSTQSTDETTMDLGAFSISLAVQDLSASRAFYEKLGFEVVGGEAAQNFLILRSGTTTIGLFHRMFERNIMTFNPGWNAQGEALESFTDVREIQRQFKEYGIELQTEADESTSGPASLMLLDPDGNPILIDQHVE